MAENNLNLPKTSFSMKANLPSKEPKILETWDKIKLYERLRKKSEGKTKFVLHDGPPYANGHIHMGTALNKILKDMNRKHTIEDYLEVVKKLKKVNPYIKFSSDFIIGYPGETEKDFNDTLQLIDKVEYINFYSFIFERRFNFGINQIVCNYKINGFE